MTGRTAAELAEAPDNAPVRHTQFNPGGESDRPPALGSEATRRKKLKPRTRGLGMEKLGSTAAAAGAGTPPAKIEEPTFDHGYLLERINEGAESSPLSFGAVQGFIRDYGLGPVSDALRGMRVVAAESGIKRPYPYLAATLKARTL